jgi:hypothetical protein
MGDQMDSLAAARREIAAIKPPYVKSKRWRIQVREDKELGRIHLFVEMPHKQGRYILRLTCGLNMPDERPREAFVNPDDWEETGPQFWPSGGPFRPNEHGGIICIPGVWGFHEILHRGDPNHPPQEQNILRTLLMIQGQLDRMS